MLWLQRAWSNYLSVRLKQHILLVDLYTPSEAHYFHQRRGANLRWYLHQPNRRADLLKPGTVWGNSYLLWFTNGMF